jgi:hypothetical protein
MDIKTSKSILAKLLAQENLNVVHAKVQTAYFDTKSRTLTLPIWQDMDGDLYDLLCGHEVGHALETPEKGWHDAIVPDGDMKKIDHALKGYLNVLEDCRIEKKIKNRYPGLRVSFYRAYQSLHEKNFFQAAGKDLREYGLIDRINLHFKLGSFIAVPFTETEKSVVKRVENLETWEEVEALARELLANAKAELQEKQEQIKKKLVLRIGPNDMSDQDDDADAGQQDIDFDEYDEIEYEFDDEAFERARLSQAEQNILDKTVPYSETDQAFRDREALLLDKESRGYEYLTIPDIKSQPFIVGYKKVIAEFNDPENGWEENQRQLLAPALAKFKLKNEKFVNYLVKEFELKRNAQQQARAKISKSGEIDTKKVFSYRYNEDIFRRFTTLPNGKNHGLIMFFDMSGSMTSQMSGAIEQMLVLVEFCRKVNIPFEVYGFTNLEEEYQSTYARNMHNRQVPVIGEVLINDNNFKLRQYFSDAMRPAEYKQQMLNMTLLARCWDARQHRWNMKEEYLGLNHRPPRNEYLNGTPLNPAVLCSIDVYEKFVKRTKAEIVNMAFMTDGESDQNLRYCSSNQINDNGYHYVGAHAPQDPDKVNLILTHKSTKKSVQVEINDRRHTKSLVRLVREVTGANIVCFDILERGGRGVIGSKLFRHYDWNDARIAPQIDAAVKTFKKERLLVVKDQGFSEYYLIPGGSDLSIDDDELDVEAGASKRDILKAFAGNQSDKKTNRILLNSFVKMIA